MIVVGRSRSGVVGQLHVGFSFLLATPVILASGVGAYVSVRFLTRCFETRSLGPFGIYCVAAGVACLLWFTLR